MILCAANRGRIFHGSRPACVPVFRLSGDVNRSSCEGSCSSCVNSPEPTPIKSDLSIQWEFVEQRDGDSCDLLVGLRRPLERRLFRVCGKVFVAQFQRDLTRAQVVMPQPPSDFVGQFVDRADQQIAIIGVTVERGLVADRFRLPNSE